MNIEKKATILTVPKRIEKYAELGSIMKINTVLAATHSGQPKLFIIFLNTIILSIVNNNDSCLGATIRGQSNK
ncbi:hypothetical protein MADA3029_270091 [Vibrio nigripulchritudo MADA3029]|nr:hypothetical protein VIBNIMADA3020_420091 [Vibrio nigripulchritudo MADA3020]CCN56524.1 hypothetical protein VIBNIMADA3021_970019 [Vibrio nigripulchritudo MADA3021]CCN58854.1 hypothetical protein MADA3029_270091 [Vibrio nigripulchritudo MADA3029]